MDNFLNFNSNDSLSNMKLCDKEELLNLLKEYKIELRKELNLNNNITFGLELEFGSNKPNIIESKLKSFNYKLLLEERLYNAWYEFKKETSFVGGYEITTPILTNQPDEWAQLSELCDMLVKNKAEIGEQTAGHIHFGTQVLGSNKENWINFFKLYVAYENLIYRFSYGEYENRRPYTIAFAYPLGDMYYKKLQTIDDKTKLMALLKLMSTEYKRKGLSFYKASNDMSFEKNKTIEFRMPNATLEPVIWQNNVNFFAHLLEYSTKNNFNLDKIEERTIKRKDSLGHLPSYVEIDIDEALEFADLVFDNNLDKINFLRQYMKSFKSNGEFIKTKSFIKK